MESIMTDSKNLSTVSILFHQTIADRLGLHITDHKCVDFLFTQGPQTAGEISKNMGLSTGAVTSLIDRLEKKGLVERKSIRIMEEEREKLLQNRPGP